LSLPRCNLFVYEVTADVTANKCEQSVSTNTTAETIALVLHPIAVISLTGDKCCISRDTGPEEV